MPAALPCPKPGAREGRCGRLAHAAFVGQRLSPERHRRRVRIAARAQGLRQACRTGRRTALFDDRGELLLRLGQQRNLIVAFAQHTELPAKNVALRDELLNIGCVAGFLMQRFGRCAERFAQDIEAVDRTRGRREACQRQRHGHAATNALPHGDRAAYGLRLS
jgi:hypothetical protein